METAGGPPSASSWAWPGGLICNSRREAAPRAVFCSRWAFLCLDLLGGTKKSNPRKTLFPWAVFGLL